VASLLALVAAQGLLHGQTPASAPAAPKRTTVLRLWDFDCGQIHSKDQSRWTPNLHVGQAVDLSDNCYLIQHPTRGLFLWDTGMADSVVAKPTGQEQGGGMIFARAKTFVSQLAAAGFTPNMVENMAFSHSHPDHTGNALLFPQAMLYIQQTEFDAAFAPNAQGNPPGASPYSERLRSSLVRKINGDFDVFGDGSITIISTPGHTPGHQSLLVRLPKRGNVILTGDSAHFKENWDLDHVPGFNFNQEQSHQSMAKLKALAEKEHAEVWINHEKQISDKIPKGVPIE
jgi:glyoxylase-like metal-dependent hydrolase (beta-lactamase superfamily II)